jgi:aminopeptidase N
MPTGTVWSGGETEYSYERKNVREIAFVLSKKFEIAKCNHNGVEISYYYYDDENPEKTLETAKQSLEYYSNEYYKYPYGEYVVCEGDFLYGGMEYPCLSLISDSAYSERDYVVAHETAHQWFYGIVGVNQSEIGYLDEGLTEYLTISFLSDRGDGDYGEYVKTAKREYLDVKNALVYQGVTTPPVMERNLKDFSSEIEYVMIAYKRSLIAIDGLKGYVGDKKFKKALKKFVSEKAFSNATTDDFISVFDKKKRGAGKFFKDFVQGKAEVIY